MTTSTVNTSMKHQDVIDSAAAWVARLGDTSLSAAEQAALGAWLAEDPAHRAAFHEAQAAWAAMDRLRSAPGILAQDIVPASATHSRKRPLRNLPHRIAWSRVAAVAACLVLAIGVLIPAGNPSLWFRADYHTAVGERQQVMLSDGTLVDLGPASAFALEYTDTERRVNLLSGLAYFTVAPMSPNEQRPFVVGAGEGTSRALGTQFMVQYLSDKVEVAVAEHSVEVILLPADATERLAVGQLIRYDDTELDAKETADLNMLTAWRRDRLIFNRMPLHDVVDVLNRYRDNRLVITSKTLAELKVSGVFDADDPDAILDTITTELHIDTITIPLLFTLLH